MGLFWHPPMETPPSPLYSRGGGKQTPSLFKPPPPLPFLSVLDFWTLLGHALLERAPFAPPPPQASIQPPLFYASFPSPGPTKAPRFPSPGLAPHCSQGNACRPFPHTIPPTPIPHLMAAAPTALKGKEGNAQAPAQLVTCQWVVLLSSPPPVSLFFSFPFLRFNPLSGLRVASCQSRCEREGKNECKRNETRLFCFPGVPSKGENGLSQNATAHAHVAGLSGRELFPEQPGACVKKKKVFARAREKGRFVCGA